VICVGGLSGTGKTGVARGLAPAIGSAPGAIHLRTDVERKHMLGKSPETRLPAKAYSEAINQAVYRRVLDRAAAVLAAGHSVIIDAGFRQPEEREAATQLARQAGVPFHGLWLEADAERMLARVEQRRGDASDAGREVVLRQLRSSIVAPHDWTSIDANGSLEQTLALAHAACGALP
jgi:predicted kinase